MDQSSLQKRFVTSLREPPLDLLERIESEPDASIWTMGTGTDRLAREIVESFSSVERLFLCDPTLDDSTLESLRDESSEGALEYFNENCLERLGKFQQNTFQVCFACWMVGTVPVSNAISLMYRVLDQSGQIGLVCMKEGSPARPLQLLKEAVREAAGRKVDFKSRGQLASVNSFRTNLTSLGFHDERVWSSEVDVSFDAPEEVFHVLLQSTGAQWKDQNKSEQQAIREVFLDKVENEFGSSPSITYEYLGATGESKA